MPRPGGRVSAKATTLKGLIETAYAVKARQISGGPSWLDSERYDIEAKAPSDVPWEPQIRFMLQTLLFERFNLRIHVEARESPIYTLGVGKNGPKLKKAEEGACVPGPNGQCGGFVTRIGQITGRKALISQLADALSGIMDRPVVDMTGLTGLYDDVKLEWVPDENQFRDWGVGAFSRLVSDPFGPSLFAALQEQLGLRLESNKGPVDIFVIDQAEKPSEN
jgi:uncharacterized protein (TIGR03435 family)